MDTERETVSSPSPNKEVQGKKEEYPFWAILFIVSHSWRFFPATGSEFSFLFSFKPIAGVFIYDYNNVISFNV